MLPKWLEGRTRSTLVRLGYFQKDPDYMLVELNKRNVRVHDVYRLNVNDGQLDLVAENPGNISGWMTDNDGKLRVATTSDGVNTSLLYRKDEADDRSGDQ